MTKFIDEVIMALFLKQLLALPGLPINALRQLAIKFIVAVHQIEVKIKYPIEIKTKPKGRSATSQILVCKAQQIVLCPWYIASSLIACHICCMCVILHTTVTVWCKILWNMRTIYMGHLGPPHDCEL